MCGKNDKNVTRQERQKEKKIQLKGGNGSQSV